MPEEAVFPYRGNVFFNECFISGNASFRAMETDFLAITTHFLYSFKDFCRGKLFFCLVDCIFERILHSGYWGVFFSLMETVTLLESFFLLAETVMSGNQILKAELILAGEN